MPFEIFRKHQKKMLAFMALFAMVAFTLDFKLFQGRGPGGYDNPFVVNLYGKPVTYERIKMMQDERLRANGFVEALVNGRGISPFGGYDTRSIVDALILQHEAEAMGIPASPAMAKRWLQNLFGGGMPAKKFEDVYRDNFADKITDETLLSEIANQIRMGTVASLPGGGQATQATPLDVFQAYRDQTQRISALAVPFRVADYVSKVPEPAESDLKPLYDKFKDVLPEKARETPGFKIPRKVRVEALTLDTGAVGRAIRPKLTDEELREAFVRRRDELPIPKSSLPENLFASTPNLTPRLIDEFKLVRATLVDLVADEKAREEVDRVFGEVKDSVMVPFSDSYDQVVEDNKDAASPKALPSPGDRLKKAAELAKVIGGQVEYESLGPIDRDQAEALPFLSQARVGISPSTDGRTFVEEMFGVKSSVYDPIEMADPLGRRYLLWKVEDAAARVPTLAECRDEVVKAWKLEKARPLAEKDAEALASAARAKSNDLKAVAGTRPIVTTDPATKFLAIPGLAPRPASLPQLPDAGEALRDAYFNLDRAPIAVASDQPKATYYVLSLLQKYPVEANRLLDQATGPYMGLSYEVNREEQLRSQQSWMKSLRKKAGLADDWKPPADIGNRGDVSTED